VGGSYAVTRPGQALRATSAAIAIPVATAAPVGTMTSWAWIVTASGLPSSHQLKQLSPAPRLQRHRPPVLSGSPAPLISPRKADPDSVALVGGMRAYRQVKMSHFI
jgi:hypothetical protein